MSNTTFPAKVEVSQRLARKATATVNIISSDKPGSLEVFQNNPGEVSFKMFITAKGVSGQTHEGTAYATLDNENAKALVRNLAKRLSMEVTP